MIDNDTYKKVLGSFPSGVTVVTAYDENNKVVGLTASAFSALSMDPALVLVCPNYHSDSYATLSQAKHFAINILAGDQTIPAFAFAKKGEEKTQAIQEIAIRNGQCNTPVIEGAVAVLECSLWREYEGGDHAILVGKVESVNCDESIDPMVYCRGKMTTWQTPSK